MKRKLIKQGAGGLTVCLPKKWTEANHLKGGDEINLEEENNQLSLSAKAARKTKRFKTTIEHPEYEFIQRAILTFYHKGIDELQLRFKENVPLDVINKSLAELTIGYEVVDVGKNFCTIKSFESASEEKIPVSIRKCFFLARQMQEILLESIKKKKFEDYQRIRAIHLNIRRLVNYTIRSSIKQVKEPNLIHYYTTVHYNLHLYTKRLESIYKAFSERKIKLANTEKYIKQLFLMFETFYETYYKKEQKLFEKLLNQYDILRKNLEDNVEKGNGKVLLHISLAMKNIMDSYMALFGLSTY